MAKPQERIGFVGADSTLGPTTTDGRQHNHLVETDLGDHAGSLEDVVRHLADAYNIEGRDVLYVEDGGAQYAVPALGTDAEGTDTGYQALVNPAWEGDGADRPQDTPVWSIATDEYAPVGPAEKYQPLIDELVAQEIAVCGEVRRYRNGGEIHTDLWLPEISVDLGGATHVVGLTTGYDYFSGTALYAEVIAADHTTGTVMRGITDKKRRNHRGAAGEDVAEWWGTMLEQAEQATDALAKTVAEAQQYEVEFSELPITSEQYLLALFDGTASYAESADERLHGGQTPDRVSAWALYSAMAQTLTEDFDGKDGSAALRKYLRGANEQLFQPPAAERTACEWLEDHDELQGQQTLDGESVVRALRDHRLDLTDAVNEYENTKQTLKRMLNEISSAEEGTA